MSCWLSSSVSVPGSWENQAPISFPSALSHVIDREKQSGPSWGSLAPQDTPEALWCTVGGKNGHHTQH